VVLITERMSLKGISTLLEQYLVVDRPFEAHALEAVECREAVRTADIVVHTLRGRQTIMRHRPQGAATLELHFEPDPVSLQRLRRTIVTQQRGSEV
jgi:hypothetical protein